MFDEIDGFEWDEGILFKNWEKHSVSHLEAEQVFFNQPLLVYSDDQHSESENRWYVLGKTDAQRPLFVVFTLRGTKIRVISARDMNRKERKIYES